MQTAMSKEAVIRTYDRWAPVYDVVFGQLFESARRAAVTACENASGRVLEVGVGTGISLPMYTTRCSIVGIDVSEDMLAMARKRVASQKLHNVEDLLVMDAQALTFPKGSFDVVTAQYVVNTVPDPEAALDEFFRVLRSGGELVIVNRIGAEAGPRLRVERLLEPFVERLGWRSEFPWSRFEAWLSRHPDARLIERRPLKPFGHFALIRISKQASA